MAKKLTRPHKKMGRPEFPYTDELVEEICQKTATHPISLERLCKLNSHWPDSFTIRKWRIEKPDFSRKYSEAKKNQIEAYVENIYDLTWNEVPDQLTLGQRKLQADIVKWHAARLAPKIYGDKVGLEKEELDTAKQLLSVFKKVTNPHEKDI